MESTGDAELDRQLSTAVEHLKAMAGLQERLAELRGEGEGADGHVQITLGSNGMVDEIDLNPRAMRLASAELAEALVAAFRDAAEDLQAKIAALFAPMSMELPSPDELLAASRRAGDEIDDTLRAIKRSSDPAGEVQRRLERLRAGLAGDAPSGESGTSA